MRDSGIVVLHEAMRAGMAVVTTPTGAGSDVIRHEQNGLIVPIGAVDETASAVARLVDQPSLRVKLATAAIKETRGRSWARAASELKEGLRELRPGGGPTEQRSQPSGFDQ